MKQLIIDRSKWRTGCYGRAHTGVGHTQLLNDEGYMCCLGFYCLQAGVPSEDLLGIGEPNDIDGVKNFYNKFEDMKLLLDKYDGSMIKSDFAITAILINDKENITSNEREQMIKEHFTSAGIEMVFEGQYEEQ